MGSLALERQRCAVDALRLVGVYVSINGEQARHLRPSEWACWVPAEHRVTIHREHPSTRA